MKLSFLRSIVAVAIGLFYVTGNAQQVSISSPCELTSDISARTYPRMDLNGNKCALLKIIGNAELISVSGNVVGEIVDKGNMYWVYLTPNTKQVVLNIKNAQPQKINFSEYDITISSGCTYEVRFEYIDEMTTVRTSGLTLLFTPDIKDVNPHQKEILGTLVKTMSEMPVTAHSNIRVRAYISTYTGTESYNRMVAGRRASKVRDALIGMGADPSRIIIETGSGYPYPNSNKAFVVVNIEN